MSIDAAVCDGCNLRVPAPIDGGYKALDTMLRKMGWKITPAKRSRDLKVRAIGRLSNTPIADHRCPDCK